MPELCDMLRMTKKVKIQATMNSVFCIYELHKFPAKFKYCAKV